MLYRSARPVPLNVRKRHLVYNTGRTGQESAVRLPARSHFLTLVPPPAVLARETTSSYLDQATGEAVDEMQTATQPIEAPGAGTATQPVKAPGSVPDVQPTCEGDLSGASDSEANQLSFTGSVDDEIHRDRSPDRNVIKDEADQEPTEEANIIERL